VSVCDYRLLEAKRFPILLRQAVFVLLGLSGVFAVLAGLSVLIGKEIITDQLSLGLLGCRGMFVLMLVRFFFLIVGIRGERSQSLRTGLCEQHQESQHPFAILSLFTGRCCRDVLVLLAMTHSFL